MKSREEFLKEHKARMYKEHRERIAKFNEKYGHLTTDEQLDMAMEFQMRAEQNTPDEPTNAEQPTVNRQAEKPKPDDKINWDSPMQRKVFEKMGMVFKVTKPDNTYITDKKQ
jgi:hypothetical protein